MADPANHTARSTKPSDYQDLQQPIGAMAKRFGDGTLVPLHRHDRDQLLYAIRGVMHLQTEHEAWVIPPDRAAYIPAQTLHAVAMHGTVHMRTLYIAPPTRDNRSLTMRVIGVSNLLRELILALSEEPLEYERDSRGERLAKLVELEVERASQLALNFPLPRDPRLQRLCAAILANPADRRTLEDWSQFAGASARTLTRLFERDLGINFNKWRQRIRFHNALDALSRGEPILQVAHQNGYDSASAFSAAFGKEMGIAPSKVASEK